VPRLRTSGAIDLPLLALYACMSCYWETLTFITTNKMEYEIICFSIIVPVPVYTYITYYKSNSVELRTIIRRTNALEHGEHGCSR